MRPNIIPIICIVVITFNVFAVIYHNFSSNYLVSYNGASYRFSDLCPSTLTTPSFQTTPSDAEDFASFQNPYRYKNRVDLRVIILTMNRPKYLRDLLDTVEKLEMGGDSIEVEIWIDREVEGNVDKETLDICQEFSRSNNFSTVHIHRSHAGLHNQWISTYSSSHVTDGEEEIVLFLEDDLRISRHSYKWLKAVHKHFSNESDYLGCSLRLLDSVHPMKTNIPSNNSVYMHRVFSTHAFSPKLEVWKGFQQWFVSHFERKSFKPYVLDIQPTLWYKDFERYNKTHTMWSIWLLYYVYIEQLFAVYSNPSILKTVTTSVGSSPHAKFTRNHQKCFCDDRQAMGLHFPVSSKKLGCDLVDEWSDEFINFPYDMIRVDWNGLLYVVL